MKSTKTFLAVLTVLVFLPPLDARADLILSGSDLPQNQGWTLHKNFDAPEDVSTDGTDLRINTWGSPGGDIVTGPSLTYEFDLIDPPDPGMVNYAYVDIEVMLQVHHSSYNLYDGGVVLMPGLSRWQMLMWTDDRILWGDMTDEYLMDTTGGFHSYRYVGDESGARVYVDGFLTLERDLFSCPGWLRIGDQTNDIGFDGDFSISSVYATVTDIWSEPIPLPPPVPVPGAALLGVLGLGTATWRLRRTG